MVLALSASELHFAADRCWSTLRLTVLQQNIHGSLRIHVTAEAASMYIKSGISGKPAFERSNNTLAEEYGEARSISRKKSLI